MASGAATPLARFLRSKWFRPVTLGLLFLVLFLPRIVWLATVSWQEEKYSHGYLVPLVSAFYLWVNRESIFGPPAKPSYGGTAIVGFGIIAWFLGQLTGFNAVGHLAMMIVLTGMVVHCGGWAFLKRVAFPLYYLVFALPIPQRLDDLYIVLPLQRLAATISARIIDLCGIPVFRQGNVVEVPGIKLFVEEACSGIHSLYSLMALGTAFVFLTERRTWERVVLIVSTVPIAVAANVIRVTLTGILASAVSPKLAQGFLHEFSGLMVFLLGLGLLLLEAAWLRALAPPREPPPASAVGEGKE